jgi:hypothetical protein
MSNAVFWDVSPSDYCMNRRFGGKYCSIIRVTRNTDIPYNRLLSHIVYLRSLFRLLVTANAVPSALILVTRKMEKMRFSESSVLIRATRHNIPEDSIFHNHRGENLISYKLWASNTWGFHGGDYEQCRLLGCDVVWILLGLPFRRDIGSHMSHTVSNPRRRHSSSYEPL